MIRIRVIGEAGGANLMLGLKVFGWGGYASEYDQHIGRKIVHVLSGGMRPGSTKVTAAQLLDLEREAFVSLCGRREDAETHRAHAHHQETPEELRTSMKTAVIVAARRSAVGKAPRGALRNTRPDEVAAQVLRKTLEEAGVPGQLVEDVLVGCAMPEAEQGLNVARNIALWAGLPDRVPGATINRYCASGLQTIAMIAERIQVGAIDVGVAGGVESMSMIPNGREHHPAPSGHRRQTARDLHQYGADCGKRGATLRGVAPGSRRLFAREPRPRRPRHPSRPFSAGNRARHHPRGRRLFGG